MRGYNRKLFIIIIFDKKLCFYQNSFPDAKAYTLTLY